MFSLPSDRRSLLNQPIANSLLLSLSLHLALLALVQPAPGGGESGTLVINARLAPPPQAVPPAAPEPVPEPDTAPATKPVMPPQQAPQALLTGIVPSPAPPLPLPATPPVAASAAESKPVIAPAAAIEAKPKSVATAAATAAATAGTNAPLSIGVDTNWYLARQVDVHARAASSIVPDYPEEARRRNQEGTLKLMVKIDDLGRVRDVEVVEADLPGVFDAAALEAFRHARFQPAMKDGRPVRYQAFIRVVFRLQD